MIMTTTMMPPGRPQQPRRCILVFVSANFTIDVLPVELPFMMGMNLVHCGPNSVCLYHKTYKLLKDYKKFN